jgi:hypothetical protein
MRRKPLKFNPIVPGKPGDMSAAFSASPDTCCSCGRSVLPDQLAGCFIPGLVEGALCQGCLYMAAHELLRRTRRENAG